MMLRLRHMSMLNLLNSMMKFLGAILMHLNAVPQVNRVLSLWPAHCCCKFIQLLKLVDVQFFLYYNDLRGILDFRKIRSSLDINQFLIQFCQVSVFDFFGWEKTS